MDNIENIVNDGRNYHVRKLLTKLGGKFIDPDLQRAIKREFSEYAEDIINQRTDYDTGHDNTARLQL